MVAKPTGEKKPIIARNRMWRLSGLGFTMASEIVAGLLIGWLIDTVVGTKDTWIIVGTITGLIIALVSAIKIGLSANRQAITEYKQQQEDRSQS